MSNELQPEYLSQQLAQIQELNEQHQDVISRQATINIGLIGQVTHGTSTLFRALTSFTKYYYYYNMNIKIFECNNSECTSQQHYFTQQSDTYDKVPCPMCEYPSTLIRHISIIECNRYDVDLMTTLVASDQLDAIILVVAADQSCPQSQAAEYFKTIRFSQTQIPIIVAQNKIDIVDETQARFNYSQIQSFLGTYLQNNETPIIPVSAAFNLNIEYIINEIVKIPVPKRKLDKPPRVVCIRSFDFNKQYINIDQMKGGIIGGTLLEGILKVGDIIEIRPGIIEKRTDKTYKCYPLTTQIISLKAENNDLRYALPGGLIAIGTLLDPSLTRSDKLIGQMIGYPGTLPDIMINFKIKFCLIIKKDQVQPDLSEEQYINQSTKIGTELLVTVNNNNISAKITSDNKTVAGNSKVIELQASRPVCIPDGVSMVISQKEGDKWTRIGCGILLQKQAPEQDSLD
ncbi:Translation_initiation factor 2 gamma subunit [Hexamita inflata]|uniref:Translation initiation factor 2 gamma subunit n=1 Tax=Hexamita inflata TaxID=28002 RepID=A0AA86V1M2_9EUKA|nr:Translation initiation factor 2 gamma subunit [Hexamita inflata]